MLTLGGGCTVPVAAYAWHDDGGVLQLRSWVALVTVYLVGAGPGDPGLVTVRARELLQRCDALVYDRLGGCPSGGDGRARCGAVTTPASGPGSHALSQDEINALLVELGGRCECVVRLKGGDPFIFGRGGEEALALRAAGLEFEVVPGISSAHAVPAYAGIPVTHRGLAAQVTVVTGHEDPNQPEYRPRLGGAWRRPRARSCS